MRALVAHAPGDFGLADLPEPVVPEGGRLIEVEAAGICGLIVTAVRLLDDFRGALEPSEHPRIKEVFIP